jgi:hypothetical protein
MSPGGLEVEGRPVAVSPEQLVRAIEEAANAVELPEPEFPYRLGWSRTYDDLLAGQFDQETSVGTLLEEVQRRGRVILHGEAGSGKTTVFRRIFKLAAESMYPVLVNLLRWSPPLFDAWKASDGNDAYRMGLLLRNLGEPLTDEADLRRLPLDRFRVVLIDGLNEVPSEVARGVLSAADSFARRNPLGGVVVADRLTRRDLPSEKWHIARLRSLEPEQVRVLMPAEAGEADPAQTELMRRPFFLNLAINHGPSTASGAEAVESFIRTHARLDDEQLDDAARGAFDMYAAYGSRTFDVGQFEEIATAPVVAQLVEAGLIKREEDSAYFVHHLYHDYLAARWLAKDPEQWGRDAFEALSFHASSFDALALALEQVTEATLADQFIREVYDWNFYASAYALGKGRQLGSALVTAHMEVALLAMLAERRWDPLRATAEAVTDALLFVPSDFAAAFLAAPSIREVQETVGAIDDDDAEYQEWKRLFLTPVGQPARDDQVELLVDDRSLLGWTASNVLRRTELSPDQEARIRGMIREHGHPRVRWRAAHALGSHPSMENARVLATAVAEDEDELVRYGAIRAITEQAAASRDLRMEILELVTGLADEIERDSTTLRQLQRALVLRDPPADWPVAVAPLVDALWSVAASVEAQDVWRRVAFEIERSVAPEAAPEAVG